MPADGLLRFCHGDRLTDLQAVATALAAMTSQPHPLAATGPDDLYRGARA
jgi:hypothetical protein